MHQRNARLRWLIVWALAVVWMAVVLARLSYLQLFCYGDYFARAQRQQQRIFEISPKRGTIYDRKGRELAVSLPMDSVFADPAEISDAEMVGRLLSEGESPCVCAARIGCGGAWLRGCRRKGPRRDRVFARQADSRASRQDD